MHFTSPNVVRSKKYLCIEFKKTFSFSELLQWSKPLSRLMFSNVVRSKEYLCNTLYCTRKYNSKIAWCPWCLRFCRSRSRVLLWAQIQVQMCFKTTIGITGVRILGREEFYWKTEEMGIIIHTSYPHPNFCRDFNFPQGQSFCPFQSSPSPHVGYYCLSKFQLLRQD
jgi:hypothetical protein